MDTPHFLKALIERDKLDQFYNSKRWKRVRAKVLVLDNYECQLCKGRGKHTRAVIVHHIKHLDERPDLALQVWDGDERQLVSVCKNCHELLHPEQLRRIPRGEQVTAERWD